MIAIDEKLIQSRLDQAKKILDTTSCSPHERAKLETYIQYSEWILSNSKTIDELRIQDYYTGWRESTFLSIEIGVEQSFKEYLDRESKMKNFNVTNSYRTLI